MKTNTSLELKIFDNPILEQNHFSNILNDMRYRGWYKFEIQEGFINHFFCLFRVPPAIPLYDNILRNLTEEERKAGLHRFLVGKDLMAETKELLEKYNNNLSECIASLNDSEVKDLLDRLQKIVTFDCNQIPYLYIKTIDGDTSLRIDFNLEVKKHILSLPNYLNIFYDTLNEKISLDQADEMSSGIIYNEYKNLFKK